MCATGPPRREPIILAGRRVHHRGAGRRPPLRPHAELVETWWAPLFHEKARTGAPHAWCGPSRSQRLGCPHGRREWCGDPACSPRTAYTGAREWLA